MLTDSTYREEFLEELTSRCARASRERAEYLKLRERAMLPSGRWRPADTVMVPGYKHVPGQPLRLDGAAQPARLPRLEISEEMAFGLGAGACFFYFPLEDQSPSRFTNGRAARLEENFLELTGAPLRMRTDEDPERSWRMARENVDAGRPALLLTDLYYLDHYGKSAHFPGHAVVLAGYDEEVAWLSDTGFEELQSTKLENLALGPPLAAPGLPALGPDDRRGAERRGRGFGPRADQGRRAGGDRARGRPDARAGAGRVSGSSRAGAARRGDRGLARDRRRLPSGAPASSTR